MEVIMGIFYFLPWWVKVVVIFIVTGVIGNITMHIIGSIDKKTIAERMCSDPALALKIVTENLESAVFTLEEYESQLHNIVQNTGYDKAMVKLAKFYAGEEGGDKKDMAQYQFWLEKAAKAGNLESIVRYYDFSDYDVKSDEYEAILCDLDNARTISEDEIHMVCYRKSIVYYKMEKMDMARQILENLNDSVLEEKSNHMLFLCLAKEGDMDKAEDIVQQMEKYGWVVPADFYLSMYQYHVLPKKGKEPDYETQIKYAEKYATCKDANETYANDMGCDAYYHLGENYWIGREKRCYRKANEYLMRAANKGDVRAKDILERFGVNGILVFPMQADKITYQFIGGYEFSVSKNTMKWLQLYYGIQYKATLIADDFKNQYRMKFHSFDALINGVHQLYTDQIVQMLRWCIFMLLSFGVDCYDAEDVIESCEDLALFSRVPMFEHGIEKIDDRAEQLNIQTAYAKATRGYWNGMGFGTTIHGAISASIKASVTAGIMNTGSKVLHSIGDSIAQSIDNAEINGMKNKLFNDPEIMNEFVNAVYAACLAVGCTARRMIETCSEIRLEALEGVVQYGGENISDVEDRTLTAKINNYLYLGDERVYVLLLERLRRNPLDETVFHRLYEYVHKQETSLENTKICTSMERYGYDFGILE